MNMKKLGIAIVGLGYWGRKYLQTFQQIPCCRLYLCDINKDVMRDININTLVDYESILTNTEVEAVIIATPNYTHYHLTRQALLHGKDVLVEKPMAMSFKQAEDLDNIAHNTKRILAVAHTPLFTDGYRQFKNDFKSGKLSPIIQIQAIRTSRGRLNNSTPLWDLSSHDIAIGISLFGEPDKTYCKLNNHQTCQYELLFNDRITFHGESRWTTPPHQRKLRVITEKGAYEYEEPIGINNRFDQLPLTLMCYEFINCCINRQEPLNSVRLGKKVIKCLENISGYKMTDYEVISNNTCL